MKRFRVAVFVVAALLPFSSILAEAPVPATNKERRSILVLGGTRFLGPHLVERALERGHEVTLFNRGRSNPGLFPELETLIGDRDPDKGAGLSALEGRQFDAVIDTSGYVPRHCRASARLFAKQAKHYVFISTISVYADRSTVGMDEDAPLATLEDETLERVTPSSYGALKALCEDAVREETDGHAAIVRPGLIVGPLDRSDRFTYWPVRLARGGEVLAPGDPGDLVQFIDVRDLAEWLVHLVEEESEGTFNAVGPAKQTSIGELIETCRVTAKSDSKVTWVPADFLDEHSVAPWSDMPVWIPPVGPYAGIGTISNRRAVEAGLRFRSVEETVRTTLAWFETLPQERRARLNAGIGAERERQVLEAWHTEVASEETGDGAAAGNGAAREGATQAQ